MRVVGFRPTKKGDLLFRIAGESNKEAFTANVAKAVGSMCRVQSVDQKVVFEIRELKYLIQEEEVQQMLLEKPGSLKVTVLGTNMQGMKLAVLVADQEEAERLEHFGCIMIGFISCSIRKRLMVTRFHRCLDYGHIEQVCKAADRSAACFRCGDADHKFAD